MFSSISVNTLSCHGSILIDDISCSLLLSQQQAAYILARGALRTTAPDRLLRVAHYLQNIQLPSARFPTGYNLALVVSGLIIKGLATEEGGDVPGGIALYDSAIDLMLASPNECSLELANWTEHALYRSGFLKLRLG